jgi:hypothetical protein
MIPPAAETANRGVPVGSTPSAFEMPIDVVPALGARVTRMFATTPSGNAFVLSPLKMHPNWPGAEAHEMVFPAAVDEAPTVAPMAEI